MSLPRQLTTFLRILRSATQIRTRTAYPLSRLVHQNGQITQASFNPEFPPPPTLSLNLVASRGASSASAEAQPDLSEGSRKYSEKSQGSGQGEPSDGKPGFEKLQEVHKILTDSLLNVFNKPMNYRIYHPELLFIDNIRDKRTNGIFEYIQQVALLRTVGHLKFAVVKLLILNTDISKEEGRITVRWRIAGISGLQVMLQFWKFKLWDWKGVMDKKSIWYDGVSYFDVGGDGLIYRHVADKMMVDKDKEIVKSPNKPILATLGFIAALLPGGSSLCSKSSHISKDISSKVNHPPPI